MGLGDRNFGSRCGVSDPRCVGDPVDTLTGAVYDHKLDLRLTGPLELRWWRYYDSSFNKLSGGCGWGHTHCYDRTLCLTAEGLEYRWPVGSHIVFPKLDADGGQAASGGVLLTRLNARLYRVQHHAQPSLEFQLGPDVHTPARLASVVQGPHRIIFRYNTTQRLVRIDDAAGRRLEVEEDEAGRVLSLQFPHPYKSGGRLLLAYAYDERGNLVRTLDAAGNGYVFEYDDANRLICRTGRKGFRFRFRYDEQGRCVLSAGDDRLYGVALSYEVPGRLTRVRRPDRGVWIYTFDNYGRLQRILDAEGGIKRFMHDDAGRVAAEVDAAQNVTHILYDQAGAAVVRVDALGHRKALPEDPNAPDPLAQPVAGHPLEYEFGLLGVAGAITLPLVESLAAMRLPNHAQRLVVTRPARPAAEESRFAGDEPWPQYPVVPMGVCWWPQPNTGRVFDDRARLVRQHDDFGRVRRWAYDASGGVVDYEDFDGGRWHYDNGSWHFLCGVVNPLGGELRFTHTTAGKLASCTDAGGTVSEYRYNRNDHLVEIHRHGQLRDRYVRDAAGQLCAKYAADGRLLLTIKPGSGGLPVRKWLGSGEEHNFAHDAHGRVTLAATPHFRVEQAYDVIGNRTRDTCNGSGTGHRYQGWRRLAQSTLLGRFSVRYEWKGRDHLVITDPGGGQHELLQHGHGLFERRWSNGSVEVAQYDQLGRCLFKSTQNAAGDLWLRRYHWSGEGELRRVEDNLRGEVRHEYDAAHRLRGRQTATGPAERFDFDNAGNLTAQPGLAGVMLDGNRMLQANGGCLRYNDRQHLEARQTPGGLTRYFYDELDQLVEVQSPAGYWHAEYDALGRRVRKHWVPAAAGGVALTTTFHWSGDQLVSETGPDGALRLYVYADALALTPLLVLDYDSVDADPVACRRLALFSDQVGAPLRLEDDNGRATWQAEVAPFGRLTLEADPFARPGQPVPAATTLNLRFPGHYFDAELGLHYNRFRYYSPELGRYIQSDPWGISGGHNLYAYLGNPLCSADVRGLGVHDENEGPTQCHEAHAEGTGEPAPPGRRRMTDAELQSAADHIRMGNRDYNPNDYHTITVTEGMISGEPTHTVTSSSPRGLTDREANRATQIFGPDVNTPPPDRPPPEPGASHSEQRGMRATQDQQDRRQATSNITPDTRDNRGVLHNGAACGDCARAQANATNSQGEPNPVTNVTGTVPSGGRTNNPQGSEWRAWSH